VLLADRGGDRQAALEQGELLTRRRDVMGSFVNGRGTNRLLGLIVAVIVSLNVFLIYQTLLG